MDIIFSDDYWGLPPAHGPKLPLPYALQIQFEPQVTPRIFYHDGIPLLLPPSRSCLGIPDQIYCLEVQVGQITTRCHEIVILSAISTPNIPGIKIIFMLHAATYLGAFFALRFLGVFGFLNSNLYLPHFHWDVRELHHANLDSHHLYKNGQGLKA